MGYNQDYERKKLTWSPLQHFRNNVQWIMLTPVFIVLMPIALIWNYGDPFRRKKQASYLA